MDINAKGNYEIIKDNKSFFSLFVIKSFLKTYKVYYFLKIFIGVVVFLNYIILYGFTIKCKLLNVHSQDLLMLNYFILTFACLTFITGNIVIGIRITAQFRTSVRIAFLQCKVRSCYFCNLPVRSNPRCQFSFIISINYRKRFFVSIIKSINKILLYRSINIYFPILIIYPYINKYWKETALPDKKN